MTTKMVRATGTRRGLILAMLLAGVSPAYAQPTNHRFEVPAQPLGNALATMAQQSQVEIIAPAELVDGLRAPAIKGDYAPLEAIQLLLRGTGLVVERVGEAFIVKQAGRVAADLTGDGDIVVTGTRIRGAPVASPVIVRTSEDMRDAGQSNLGEAVRAIPQNFSGGQNPGVGVSVGGAQNENLNGASTINLRGLGPDATLTLLNGHRLAYGGSRQSVDISAIPLAAVERIEIVADGASALYGSDAVAGVANIILKRDFEGLNTSIRFGAATDGGDVQQQYGAVAGSRWSSGGIIAAYSYEHDTPVVARQRSYTQNLYPTQTLVRGQSHHGAVGAAHQQLAPGVTIRADGYYSHRSSSNILPFTATADYTISGRKGTSRSSVFALAPSLDWQAGGDWELSLSGLYAQDRTHYGSDIYRNQNVIAASRGCYCNTATSVDLAGDGPLFRLGGGDARLAAGGGYRSNRLRAYRTQGAPQDITATQDSWYGYVELSLPLVSPSQDIGLVDRLNATAALRYESYEGGDRLATPKIGLIYAPSPDFELKASWGKSFKTPTLFQRYTGLNAELDFASAFGATGLPPTATALVRSGGNPDLKAERATSQLVSLVAHPRAIEGARLEISWFRITYRDRIVQPVTSYSSALSSPFYRGLVTRDPTLAEIDDALEGANLFDYTGLPFDPASIAAIIDNRYLNVARQKISGIDVAGSYRAELAAGGTLNVSGDFSWLNSRQRLSSDQPVQQLSGRIFNPPRYRARGRLAWDQAGFTLSFFGNFIGGVTDDRRAPEQEVDGMTTFDLVARYRIENGPALVRGLDVTLSLLNVFNAKPYRIRTTIPYAEPYDSTNYSAIGRFVGLSIAKQW